MQFNHPEVLYALFLLIIPILIHLFQLRRFKKEEFTNVKFLKRLSEQTRKSSQLKKWLVLITRLLLLSCIIFAFAQPYFPADNKTEEVKMFIYLDNSYSMQARSAQGSLFQLGKQELLKFLPEDQNITLFTNDEEFKEVSKNDIQEIDFSPTRLDLNTLLLKVKSAIGDHSDKTNLLLVSDLQNWNGSELKTGENLKLFNLNLNPAGFKNISLDTAYLSDLKAESRLLKVKLSATGAEDQSTSVSLYDDEQLLGKTGLKFKANKDTVIQFQLQNDQIKNGIIKIEDNGLAFDNILYFNINKVAPINVVSISSAEDLFLKKIYTQPQFNLTQFNEKNVDYNALEDAQVIVLNELAAISNSLENTLVKKAKEKSIFAIIPSLENSDPNLKLLYNNMGLPVFSDTIKKQKLITGIEFNHPLFKDAFEKRVSNFDYPKVENSYFLNNTPGTLLLSFEDRRPFLLKSNNNYVFTAPINLTNSNFLQSPLVVLSFFNIGLTALKPSQIYYTLGTSNSIDIPVKTNTDEILEIKSEDLNFIPQQQQFNNFVRITTTDLPRFAGNYKVGLKDSLAYNLSFNVDRIENNLNSKTQKGPANIQKIDSLLEFNKLSGLDKEVDSFWKWFVTFALIFLIIETLLLKYFK